MKLLVCDVEGTIFQPHRIKDAQHASYIWTAIAERLGKGAEEREIETQQKWKNNEYGPYNTGNAYMQWVEESIAIHREYGLSRGDFEALIARAPYVPGVEEFFHRLNREEYIPVFISGGIQNLNLRACRELGVDADDSYAACEYFFNSRNQIDRALTFMNTSNFFGKQELIRIALRKYGLGREDWVFIGDGINDVDTARVAPLAIGIHPVKEMEEVCQVSVEDFTELLASSALLRDWKLLSPGTGAGAASPGKPTDYRQRVMAQVGKLPLEQLARWAYRSYLRAGGLGTAKARSRFFGVLELLEDGERILSYLEEQGVESLSSAVLQPFCCATENVVNAVLALSGHCDLLELLFSGRSSFRDSIEGLENQDLKTVLHAYRKNRNTIAHAYQPLSPEAARSLARRTYENIQRLELIANPPEEERA